MKAKELEEYKKFMNNEENSHNCSECPANEGFSEWPGHRLPCGQFHCWVDCTNKERENELQDCCKNY